jgi:hypothetical protein
MINFYTEYQTLDDDAILRIAADRENLLEEARQALDSELLRRKLTQSDIGQYQKHVERAEIEEQVASLPFLFPQGIGKRLFGKRSYASNPAERWEEFDTELWIVIFWIPLIPVATFRIRRMKEIRPFGPWQNYRFTVISRRGRDWRLMLSTWAWFLLAIMLLLGTITLLGRLRFR